MNSISLRLCSYIFFITAAILIISEGRYKGTKKLTLIRLIGYPIFIGVILLQLSGIPE